MELKSKDKAFVSEWLMENNVEKLVDVFEGIYIQNSKNSVVLLSKVNIKIWQC